MGIYLWLTSLSLVGAHECIRRSFPDEYNAVCLTLAYNAIYIYSRIQIAVTKLYNYVFPYIAPLIESFKNSNYVEFIKDGHIIHSCDTTTALKYNYIPSTKYDFILHHIGNNVVIYKTLPDTFSREVVLCRYSFLIFEIRFNDEEAFNIKLNSPEKNFMVDGNLIDKTVVKYLFNKNFNVINHESLINSGSYFIFMMDNKINSQIISSNSSICLYEYSYTVDDPELKLEPSLQMDLCEDETESVAEPEPVVEPESEQVVEQASAVVEETSAVVEETSAVEPINETNSDNSSEQEIVVVPKRTYKRKQKKNHLLEKC
jgi:hypothetical protein